MKGITTYKITTKIKLKSLAESKRIDEALVKHYTFILEHFDDIIATHDNDIAEIEDKKAEILKQFIEAPQQLKELNQHLTTLTKSKKNITEKDTKVKRIKHLRERLAILIQECEARGINIDEVQENIDELKKEETANKVTAKVASEAVETI